MVRRHANMKKRSCSVGQIIINLSVLVLVIASLVQIVLQAKKYASNQKTLATSSKHVPELEFPALSFCLGFKREKTLLFPWMIFGMMSDNDTTFPSTEESVNAVWDDVTLDLQDIQVEAQLNINFAGDLSMDSLIDLLGKKYDPVWDVKEHNTLNGKCYTLKVKIPLTRQDTLHIRFKNLTLLSQPQLTLYYHHPSDILGLNEDFWIASISSNQLNINVVSGILLRKKIMKWKAPTVSEDDYVKCVNGLLTKWAKNLNRTSSFCWFPSFESILTHASFSKNSLPVCTDIYSYYNFYHEIYKALFTFTSGTNVCEPSSEQAKFEGVVKPQVKVLPDDITVIFIYYAEDMEVITEEEYILMDFPAMLAAVGGFAGMMLGWSVKDLAGLLGKLVDNWMF